MKVHICFEEIGKSYEIEEADGIYNALENTFGINFSNANMIWHTYDKAFEAWSILDVPIQEVLCGGMKVKVNRLGSGLTGMFVMLQ